MKKIILLLNFLTSLSLSASNSEPVPVRALRALPALHVAQSEENIKEMEKLLNDPSFDPTKTNTEIDLLLEQGGFYRTLLSDPAQKNLESYVQHQLIYAIQNLDINKIQTYLNVQYDLNYEFDAFEMRSKYNHNTPITPLTSALLLENLNEKDEKIRRDIIILLLENGANPLIMFKNRDFFYHSGKNNCVFEIDNVINNPELAKFLVEAGKKYTKNEYIQNFIKDKTLHNPDNLTKSERLNNLLIEQSFIAGIYLIAGANINAVNPVTEDTALFTLLRDSQKIKEQSPESAKEWEDKVSKLIEFFYLMGAKLDHIGYEQRNVFHFIHDQKSLKFVLNSEPFASNPELTQRYLNSEYMLKTPLSSFIRRYHLEPDVLENKLITTELLLKHGARPTEHQIKASISNPAMFKLLLSHSTDSSVVIDFGEVFDGLIRENKYDVKFIIDDFLMKYPFNQKNLDKALQTAATFKRPKYLTDQDFAELTDALLLKGANPNTLKEEDTHHKKTKEDLIKKHDSMQKQKQALSAYKHQLQLTAKQAKISQSIPNDLIQRIAKMALEE